MKGIRPRQPKNDIRETQELYSARNPPTQKRTNGPGRIRKACEPCRLKKARCDGKEPCSTCRTYNRTCVFSERHRREIRKWVCDMQSTIDEAIKRLYYACEKADCFPGVLPEKQDGDVTIESILHGLGLDRPEPPSHHELRPQPQHPGQARPNSSTSHKNVDELAETLLDLVYPRPHDYYSDATTERSSQSPVRSTNVSRSASKAFPLSRTTSNMVSTTPKVQREEASVKPAQAQAQQHWSTETDLAMRNHAPGIYQADGFLLQQESLWHSMQPQRQSNIAMNNPSQLQLQLPLPAHAMPEHFVPTNFNQHPPFYDMNTLTSPMTGMGAIWPTDMNGEEPLHVMHMSEMQIDYPTQGWHHQHHHHHHQ